MNTFVTNKALNFKDHGYDIFIHRDKKCSRLLNADGDFQCLSIKEILEVSSKFRINRCKRCFKQQPIENNMAEPIKLIDQNNSSPVYKSIININGSDYIELKEAESMITSLNQVAQLNKLKVWEISQSKRFGGCNRTTLVVDSFESDIEPGNLISIQI